MNGRAIRRAILAQFSDGRCPLRQDFYPSEYAEDLTWHMVVQPGGDLPAARGQSSMVVMGEKLYVFGGVTSYMTGKSLNTTHEFNTKRESWQARAARRSAAQFRALRRHSPTPHPSRGRRWR